jgi:hypothetical protein
MTDAKTEMFEHHVVLAGSKAIKVIGDHVEKHNIEEHEAFGTCVMVHLFSAIYETAPVEVRGSILSGIIDLAKIIDGESQ